MSTREKAGEPEISAKGRDALAALPREYLEANRGLFAAVDVDTGVVYAAEKSIDAVKKAKASRPNARVFVSRIGFDYAYATRTR